MVYTVNRIYFEPVYRKELIMKIFFSQNHTLENPIEEDLEQSNLQDAMKQTRYALEIAYAGFDNATDPDLIDCYIYEVNALLKKYKYLSEQAVQENVLPANDLNPQSPIHALVSHVFS